MSNGMFHEAEKIARTGEVNVSESFVALEEVETYFLRKMQRSDLEVSYDCTAHENPYFKTLNYTTYAGCFIMNPLQAEVSLRQTYEALGDRESVVGPWDQYFLGRINSKDASKYKLAGEVLNKKFKAVVVLPGSNKLKGQTCLDKIKWIRDRYRKDVAFKPHPLTNTDMMSELKAVVGKKSVLLDPQDDLYSIMTKADIVYTSHLSESAIYAALLGIEISPIDAYGNRPNASFNHINYHLFFSDDPKDTVNRMFSSYKSGVINPSVDLNWKKKIDDYINYIMTLRSQYKFSYL